MTIEINKNLFVLAAQGIGLSKDFDRYLEGKNSFLSRFFGFKQRNRENSLRKQIIEINKADIIKELKEKFYPTGLALELKNLSTEDLYKKLDEKAREKGYVPPSAGYTVTPFYKNNGTKRPAGYVIKTGNKAFVCYHGTKFGEIFDGGYKEMHHDLQSTPVDMNLANGDVIQVHEGFKKEYEASKKSLYNVLNNFPKGTEIIIPGHSLGGGIAQIAALDAQTNSRRNFNVAAVLVYGSPPVFAKEVKDYVNSHLGDKTFRLEQTLDPVPSLFSNKFSHIGKQIIGDAGSIKIHGSNTYNHMTANRLEQKNIDEAKNKGTAKIENIKKLPKKSFLSLINSTLTKLKPSNIYFPPSTNIEMKALNKDTYKQKNKYR